MDRKLLDIDALAELLGFSSDWVIRNWRRLVADHGFPAPLPAFDRPRWDPAAIARWLDAHDPRAHGSAADPDTDTLAAELRGRAGRVAGEI